MDEFEHPPAGRVRVRPRPMGGQEWNVGGAGEPFLRWVLEEEVCCPGIACNKLIQTGVVTFFIFLF